MSKTVYAMTSFCFIYNVDLINFVDENDIEFEEDVSGKMDSIPADPAQNVRSDYIVIV